MKRKPGLFFCIGIAACLMTACQMNQEISESTPESEPAQLSSVQSELESAPEESVSVIGIWDCIMEVDSQTYIFRFEFLEDGTMTYGAGWYRSEWAATYSGTYTIEGNVLSMELSCNEEEQSLKSVFSVESGEGNLLFTLKSGDPVTIYQGVGQSMEYKISTES